MWYINMCSHSGLVVPETTLSFALALISGLANRFEIRKQKKSSHAYIFVNLLILNQPKSDLP